MTGDFQINNLLSNYDNESLTPKKRTDGHNEDIWYQYLCIEIK